MVDLSAAYQEVKTLPDEALARELSNPSGMMPGYLVMAEMEDRKAIRTGGGGTGKRPSMKEELLGGIGSAPQGYSTGGLVSALNPGYTNIMSLIKPDLAQQQASQQMMDDNKGYFMLGRPGELSGMALPSPPSLSAMTPTASAQPGSPQPFDPNLRGIGSIRGGRS